MQENFPNHKLPNWLSWSLLIFFVFHFVILVGFQFSGTFLPKKLYFVTNRYVSPWFYQNWRVFAPEPPTFRRIFVYRTNKDNHWSTWKNPSFSQLSAHWSNRFSCASEMLDMIEALGDNLAFTAERSDVSTYDNRGMWESLPAFKSAKNFIQMNNKECDSLQFAVLIEYHIDVNEQRTKAFTLYPFRSTAND